jgi:hypothetical protein
MKYDLAWGIVPFTPPVISTNYFNTGSCTLYRSYSRFGKICYVMFCIVVYFEIKNGISTGLQRESNTKRPQRGTDQTVSQTRPKVVGTSYKFSTPAIVLVAGPSPLRLPSLSRPPLNPQKYFRIFLWNREVLKFLKVHQRSYSTIRIHMDA